jgi:hypothetical protein
MGTKNPSLAENWIKKIKTLRQKKYKGLIIKYIGFTAHFITNFGAFFNFFHSQFLICYLF